MSGVDINAELQDAGATLRDSRIAMHGANAASSKLGVFLIAAIACCLGADRVLAVTPESPEVLAMIDRAIAHLDKQTPDTTHDEVGSKCLIALAYLKRGAPEDHPRIVAALKACQESVASEKARNYNYGKAIAIIFLAELNSASHRDLINKYVSMLEEHQKPHGGFGYITELTGDTSQTQYAALAYWELMNHGISPDPTSVQNCLAWIMRTRDPKGVWGYQGVDPGPNGKLVEQTSNPGVSMAAAGMCTSMLLGNCLGLLNPPTTEVEAAAVEDLPPALRREAAAPTKVRAPALPSGSIDRDQLKTALEAGREWYAKNFSLEVPNYQSYYLYSVERYKSFEEFLSGERIEEPPWYNQGVAMLKKSQQPGGSWNDGTGDAVSTAFSVLFLLRSTRKSIEASLGQGTLVGGRGLPRDLSKVRIQGGKLVVQRQPTEVDQLLGMLDDSNADGLDSLLDDPAALQVTDVGPEQARRLEQVVKSGSAGVRLLAVRALGKLRDVDHAPTLIFALTDPDKRVVREARDGLRLISRNFEGYGPPDNFEEADRTQAIGRWKAWYGTARPESPPLP